MAPEGPFNMAIDELWVDQISVKRLMKAICRRELIIVNRMELQV